MQLMSVLFLHDVKNWLATHPQQSHTILNSPNVCLNRQLQSLTQHSYPTSKLQQGAELKQKALGVMSYVILLHLQQPMFPTLNITSCDPSVDQCAVCNLGDTGNLQFSRAICVKDLKPQILNFIRYQSESIKHFGAADFGLF